MYFTAFPTVKSAMRNYKMVTLHFEFSPKQRRLRKRGKMKRYCAIFQNCVLYYLYYTYITVQNHKPISFEIEKNW